MTLRRLADGSFLVGPARSQAEVNAWLLNEAVCPECGDARTVPIPPDPLSERDALAARVGATCLGCGKLSRFAFERGPGWGSEPLPGDPRIAVGEAPSQILPEGMWLRWLEEAKIQLDDHAGVDLRSQPDEAVWVQDAALRGLAALSELRKQRRAAGRELSEADRGAGRRFAEAFRATVGELPEGFAWLGEGAP